jgi:phosphinothricin acetyltransferase
MSALVRVATKADAEAISTILNYYVGRSTATFITEPQTLKESLDWLEAHGGSHPVIVAEEQGLVVAWAALSSFRPRAAYKHTVELSVYVHHEFHRRGLGRALITELLVRAREASHHIVIGGACSESLASIALLEAFGFSRIGQFHQVGRKFDRWLDVVFYQLVLQ